MYSNFKTYIFLACICFLANTLFGTHNRAGEITWEQIGPLTIRLTITTYTKSSSVAADRDSLELFWGDGTSEFVKRANGNGIELPNDIKFSIYIATHTYPGRSTYTAYFTDPNRVANILNVNFPNSVDVLFFLSTTFTLLDDQFQGINNSVKLLQPPIDNACVGQRFIHNPGAYDPDGDSIAYELIAPLEGLGMTVPNYLFPDQLLPGPNNQINFNPLTGDFVWDSPPQPGEYNIAIAIKEYREGVLINTIIRDMQIRVSVCNNEPPIIESERKLCVVAGEEISLDIQIDDPNLGQQVQLQANGGPLIINNSPAVVNPSNEFLNIPFIANLYWNTNCSHIKKFPYQITLKAVDNPNSSLQALATLRTISITVSGPAPENLQAKAENGSVKLTWDFPYQCDDDSTEDFFQGFSVWRSERSIDLERDTCNPGLAGKGYQRIFFNSLASDGDKYFYTDGDVERGKTYCYRIQAEFGTLTNAGFPYNRVESLFSDEVCIQINRDVPLITKVSVEATDQQNGVMHIRWTKPLTKDLDTLQNPGPYAFNIQRKLIDESTYSDIPGATFQINNLSQSLDTNFFDTNLNTEGSQYEYRVEFRWGESQELYDKSSSASSIFLNINPTDRVNELVWSERVPWSNKVYEVYRQNASGDFDLIAVTRNQRYFDLNLENNKSYCYKVKSIGTYGIADVEEPIINFSQEVCATPNDNVAPCSTTLSVSNICDDIANIDGQNIFNRLTWTDPNFGCDRLETLSQFVIYYQENPDEDFKEIHRQSGSQDRVYLHFQENIDLSGCYYVTSLDPKGNESEPSNIVCKDNCPQYELPNTFTPNQDGFNDLFRPTKNFFIDKVKFQVFNIWGNLVFETADPDINWDGKDMSDNELSEGTYYYVCSIFELRVDGVKELSKSLSGYIHLIR